MSVGRITGKRPANWIDMQAGLMPWASMISTPAFCCGDAFQQPIHTRRFCASHFRDRSSRNEDFRPAALRTGPQVWLRVSCKNCRHPLGARRLHGQPNTNVRGCF